ncbi:MAG: hypothetical protein GXO66_07730 [Euryarchaeota archaeon]|nr:hypothetical protein [Euryarchaeota archaeon]
MQLYRAGSFKPALLNGAFGFACLLFSIHYLFKNDVVQFAVLFVLGLAFFALALRISSGK